MNKPPKALYWFFTSETVKGKKYLKDIDYVAEKTDFDYLGIICQDGVIKENIDQCHPIFAEAVEYAHKKGIKIGLTISGVKGFLNAKFDATREEAQLETYTIDNLENAQALIQEYELTLDKNGYCCFEHNAEGARQKIRPLYNKLVKVYAFEKTADGFYKEDSLCDITQHVRILESRTHKMTAEIDVGNTLSEKNVYIAVAQYYNSNELFGTADCDARKKLLDAYSDIPFDGICMDEYGYMLLDTNSVNKGSLPPFRKRFYSSGQKRFFESEYGTDLDRLLFDMRYAPENDDSIRIKAINLYFDSLRQPIIKNEILVAEYAKKLFGKNIYISAHNTFHNNMEQDEIWHTACAWWDLPRKYGHTDEKLPFPIRMGILLSAESPLMMHMYYYKDHYREMAEDAPFNIRIFHHALDDFYWGDSFREPQLVENIRKMENQIARLNSFQTAPPKMDLLIIYGYNAQNNWYPNKENRNVWDINGSLDIFGICNEIWENGYRAALVPDYAITDGRVTVKNKKVCYNGYEFSNCLFLYPQYAKKDVFKFINNAYNSNVSISVVGEGNIDFDGEENQLSTPVNPNFSIELPEKMGCEKLGIPNGCIYTNGGFCVMHLEGMLNGVATPFDFTADGVHYSGVSTGMVAYRKGDMAFATPESKLYVDGVEIKLEYQ